MIAGIIFAVWVLGLVYWAARPAIQRAREEKKYLELTRLARATSVIRDEPDVTGLVITYNPKEENENP